MFSNNVANRREMFTLDMDLWVVKYNG